MLTHYMLCSSNFQGKFALVYFSPQCEAKILLTTFYTYFFEKVCNCWNSCYKRPIHHLYNGIQQPQPTKQVDTFFRCLLLLDIVFLRLLRNFLKVSFHKVGDVVIVVVVGCCGSSSWGGLCSHALKLRQVVHTQLGND